MECYHIMSYKSGTMFAQQTAYWTVSSTNSKLHVLSFKECFRKMARMAWVLLFICKKTFSSDGDGLLKCQVIATLMLII